MSILTFIEKSNEIHKNKYDYSLVIYKNCNTKVKIICPIHGIFEQTPKYHLIGNCPKCSRKYKLNKNEFVEKSNKIHNNKYDYTLVKYINSKTKVKIICPVHGEFLQSPISHMKGIGCSKCSGMWNYTTNDFINKANEIHDNEYDYSLVKYIDSKTKIKIICKKHGIFEQTPNNHIYKKSKCPKCNVENKRLTLEEFIEKSKSIHGNKYDYSFVNYKNNITKVKIKCNKCNKIFFQTPNSHYVKKQGCPTCKESVGEKNICSLLNDKNIKYIRQYTFDDCRDKYKLPFDFYLPDFNVCIEFDGKQHYEPIEYWGGENNFELIKKHDFLKNNYCKNKNITLIRIKYDKKINMELWDTIKYQMKK